MTAIRFMMFATAAMVLFSIFADRSSATLGILGSIWAAAALLENRMIELIGERKP